MYYMQDFARLDLSSGVVHHWLGAVEHKINSFAILVICNARNHTYVRTVRFSVFLVACVGAQIAKAILAI